MKKEEFALCKVELIEEYDQNEKKIKALKEVMNLKDKEMKKTKYQKREFKIRYQIEIKKLETHNQVLKKTIKRIENEESMIQALTHKYTITEKRCETKEQIEDKIESTKDLLKKQYKVLDMESTREVLADEFQMVRKSKLNQIVDFILRSMRVGVFACYIVLIPLLFDKISTMVTAFSLALSLFGAGTLISSIFAIREYRQEKKLFAKLNTELKEYALPQYEKDDLENVLEAEIQNTSKTQVQLQEQLRLLEDIQKEESKATNSHIETNVYYNMLEENDFHKENHPKQKIKRMMISRDYQQRNNIRE